jgi:polar amino acid transport system substrate-binding protein
MLLGGTMQHLAKRAQKHHARDRRIYLFSLVVVALVSAWVFWPSHPDLPRDLSEGKPLRIGYAEEAPFAFTTPDGSISGEAPEVARLVAARLGISPARLTFHPFAFAELIPALKRGEIDMSASGMFITSAREQEVRFSLPTESVSPGLLVQKGNPRGLQSYRDLLQLPVLRVAVLRGSVEESFFRRARFEEARLQRVLDANHGQLLVELGTVDALALSAPTLYWMESQSVSGRVECLTLPDPPPALFGEPAFAFRREDGAFVDEWNRALQEVMRGSQFKRIQREFGFLGRVEAKGPATTKAATP